MYVAAVRRCVMICSTIDQRLIQEVIQDVLTIHVFRKSSRKSLIDDIDGGNLS